MGQRSARDVLEAMVGMFASGDASAAAEVVSSAYLDDQGLGAGPLTGVESFTASCLQAARALSAGRPPSRTSSRQKVALWRGSDGEEQVIAARTWIDIVRVVDGREWSTGEPASEHANPARPGADESPRTTMLPQPRKRRTARRACPAYPAVEGRSGSGYGDNYEGRLGLGHGSQYVAGLSVRSPSTRADSPYNDGPEKTARQMLEIVLLRGVHGCSRPGSGQRQVSVDHIGGSRAAEEFSNLVSPLRSEPHNVAAAQETAQLHLPWRSADLSYHRSCRERNNPKLKTGAMISPDVAIVALSRNQQPGVVHRAHAERRPVEGRNSSATRLRAASISASVSEPCSCSHSATASRPSRTSRALRAAAVIQAETLIPSWAAAATTCSATSGSTVIASFGEGFPLGMS